MNQTRAFQVLLAPCISEKTTNTDQLYAFKVLKDAKKSEIKCAVEDNFNVAVKSVRVLNVKGRSRRFKQTRGKTKTWKKAYVMLSAGSEIVLADDN